MISVERRKMYSTMMSVLKHWLENKCKGMCWCAVLLEGKASYCIKKTGNILILLHHSEVVHEKYRHELHKLTYLIYGRGCFTTRLFRSPSPLFILHRKTRFMFPPSIFHVRSDKIKSVQYQNLDCSCCC